MNRVLSQSEYEFLSGLGQVSFSAAEQNPSNIRRAYFPRTSSLASVRNGRREISQVESKAHGKLSPRNVYSAENLASLDSHDSGVRVNFATDKRNSIEVCTCY